MVIHCLPIRFFPFQFLCVHPSVCHKVVMKAANRLFYVPESENKLEWKASSNVFLNCFCLPVFLSVRPTFFGKCRCTRRWSNVLFSTQAFQFSDFRCGSSTISVVRSWKAWRLSTWFCGCQLAGRSGRLIGPQSSSTIPTMDPPSVSRKANIKVMHDCMRNSRKSVRWSAVPVAPMWAYVDMWWWEGLSRLEFELKLWI